jgi:hypothetical protein
MVNSAINWKHIFATAVALLLLQLFWVEVAHAVPAYARQTAMNCNSCHVGTYNVPNFTRTGRLFAMRGYTRPHVGERLRAQGDTGNNNEKSQYGGDYLALNWTDYFSARFISEFARGGEDAQGRSLDVTSEPLSRLSLFYTGAITDWLGIWTELGYLGNNALRSVGGDATGGETGLNLFAYDEYRIATSWDFGEASFFGFSLGNEHPNTVGQFNFPLPLPDFWYNGQGGVGRSMNIANMSAQMFYNDRWWMQVSGVTGGDNTNWSDGNNWYVNIARNFIRTQENDVWAIAEVYTGNDFESIMTPRKNSFICDDTDANGNVQCPNGINDANLSIVNVPGFTASPIVNAPVEEVDDFFSYKLSLQNAVADMGVHSWYAAITLHGMDQDFESGGDVTATMLGASFRYFYQRTYAFEVYLRDHLTYEYTEPNGNERDTFSKEDYGMTAYWYPAMNVNLWINWMPRNDNIVFKDERQLYNDERSSYVVGMEYNF